MEAKAPEKLYLIQHNGLICYCRNNKDDIEYTRTDAFIEKACVWLERNFNMPNDFEYHFRKAMEK